MNTIFSSVLDRFSSRCSVLVLVVTGHPGSSCTIVVVGLVRLLLLLGSRLGIAGGEEGGGGGVREGGREGDRRNRMGTYINSVI